jgi:diacylglycerol kinase
MTTRFPVIEPAPVPSSSAAPRRRGRAPWRQRLVDVERGVTQGLRSDSAFFVHFFLASIVIAASVVLGISVAQWTIVILALTLVLSAEMFNQVLKTLAAGLAHELGGSAQVVRRIGTAAVFVAFTGAMIVIALTLGQAFMNVFDDVGMPGG